MTWKRWRKTWGESSIWAAFALALVALVTWRVLGPS